jgi:cytidylate kinase
MSRIINVAIDGPSGAGKSSLAKKVAAALGFVYVDTGAMYRSIAYYMLKNGIDPKCENDVVASLPSVELNIVYRNGEQRMILNGLDVSDKIRTPEISMGASAVSAIPRVREFLLETQRALAATSSVVMDGRDIATVILPNADVKIFLTANDRRRAERRFLELSPKDPTLTLEKVYADMVDRDRNDSTRKVAPAVKAEDAVLLDNTDLDEEGTLARALEIIREKTEV